MASLGNNLRIISASKFALLFEHDLFGKPVSTFPDHALSSVISRQFVEAFLQGPIQDFDGPVDFVGRDGQWRRDTPDGSALGTAADVHAQPVLEAFPGCQSTQ